MGPRVFVQSSKCPKARPGTGMYDARMAQRSQRPRAAIAFKAHTGWAAALVVAEAGEGIEILAKERVKMRDGFQAAAVYHVGHEQGLTSDQARPMIENARRESVVRAKKAIAAIAESVAGRCSLERAAVLAGGGRPLPDLDAILRSHPLVHAAEGELYRDALADACESLGYRVLRVAAKGLAARAPDLLGLADGAVTAKLASAGAASGRPWAAEQRECALAAWIALAGDLRRR